MNQRFQGKRALVTGGSKGIGAAIAHRLAEEGASVTITGTKAAFSAPQGMSYLGIDFSDRRATEAFVATVRGLSFDILVNNAGINKIGPAEEIKAEDFDRIQEVNVRAPFLLSQAVLPGMRQRKWGRIVNIGSIFGLVTKEQRLSYTTSKAAISGLTRTLAVEGAADGILVNCVAPGFIDTELTRAVLGEAGIKEMASQVPMKRLGMPEEVAAFTAWLVSAENKFLTGQVIAVDGGFTCV